MFSLYAFSRLHNVLPAGGFTGIHGCSKSRRSLLDCINGFCKLACALYSCRAYAVLSSQTIRCFGGINLSPRKMSRRARAREVTP